jgi:hypothetical protein
LEAAIGFEPMHGGFADLSLNHLGTPPRVGCCRDRTHSTITRGKTHQLSIRAHAVAWAHRHSCTIQESTRTASGEDVRIDHEIKWGAERPHLKGGDSFGTAHGQK